MANCLKPLRLLRSQLPTDVGRLLRGLCPRGASPHSGEVAEPARPEGLPP